MKDCGCGEDSECGAQSHYRTKVQNQNIFGESKGSFIFLAVLAATFPCLFGTSYRFPTSAVAGPIPSERPGGGCIQQ